MTTRSFLMRGLLAAAVALPMGFTSTPAAAQGRCYSLWHQRNSIYAANGYCFRTQRAIAEFGRGCFRPYGRMSRYEQQQVAAIQRREARLGCPRD